MKFLLSFWKQESEDSFQVKCIDNGEIRVFDLEGLKDIDRKVGVSGIPSGVRDLMYPRGNKSAILAKYSKNNEFYTRLVDIVAELEHYNKKWFEGKVIYCPTDVAIDDGFIKKSNFVEYFQQNKGCLNFKKLIATCLAEKGSEYNNKYILERKETENGVEWVETYGQCAHDFDRGYSSGDYRSEECTKLLAESDIVITNPPFSIFRDFFSWITLAGKDMLVISNSNAVVYSEIFPYFKNEKLRLGGLSWSTGMFMHVPKWKQDELKENHKTGCYLEDKETGEVYAKVSCMWFTTLVPNTRDREPVDLLCKYEGHESDYPKYENYDAIEVSKVENIPTDYDGLMGVPVTYLDKTRSDLFEIVGMSKQLANPIIVDNKKISSCFVLNGKTVYERLVIRRRTESKAEYSVGTKLSFQMKGNFRDTFYGCVEEVDGTVYYVRTIVNGESSLVSSNNISTSFEFEGDVEF